MLFNRENAEINYDALIYVISFISLKNENILFISSIPPSVLRVLRGFYLKMLHKKILYLTFYIMVAILNGKFSAAQENNIDQPPLNQLAYRASPSKQVVSHSIINHLF